MKWETVTSTIGQSVFALWNNGRQLVTLAFNPSSNTARIECEDQKRVFLIRKQGLFRSKTVLMNEYGVTIGHTGSIGHENFVELDNHRFFYSVDEKEGLIRIFSGSKENPIAIYEMSVDALDKETSRDRRLSDKTYYSLLMTLCWYLFQPAGQQRSALTAA